MVSINLQRLRPVKGKTTMNNETLTADAVTHKKNVTNLIIKRKWPADISSVAASAVLQRTTTRPTFQTDE